MSSRVKRRSGVFLGLLLGVAGPLPAQLAPPATGGAARLDELLQQLAEPRRLLVIGAHPDDEDTALLTLLARGYGADAAYLSLSRGEGGQNLIGDELGADLGVLRTRELEAARAVDGARQFFTRAFDFGYTRSLDETSRFWLPDSIVKDVVRVMRHFRPHVVVPVFSGTPRDGHGQHQMSAVAARRAFALAGDASAFPELQAEEGLAPWSPLKLYRSTRFDRNATTLSLATGVLDPRTGRTYYQIAMASRSRHRSQDFGVLERIGPSASRLQLVETRVGTGTNGTETGLFDGIAAERGWLSSFADSLRGAVSPARLADAVEPLAAAARRLAGEPPVSLLFGDARSPDVARVHEALAIAAGVVLDVRSPDPDLVAGQRVPVEVEVYNAGRQPVRVRAAAAHGDIGSHEITWVAPQEVAPGDVRTIELPMTVLPDASPTQPYFLDAPRIGSLYDWSHTPPETRGLPFGPAPLVGEVLLDVGGTWIRLEREVTYRYRDQAVGEIREPLRVVPLVDVALSATLVVWPVAGPATHSLEVTLTSNADTAVTGTIGLAVDGARAPAPQSFALERNGAKQTFTFRVTRPPDVRRADVAVRAVARTEAGASYDVGTRVIAYSHVRPTQVVAPATATLRVAPVAFPLARTIGYVRGAADRVPEALRDLGVPLELLDARALATGDLSRFDAIVIGARAYETDTALTRYNDRLLAYARGGGHLIVQYQQYAFVDGGFAPFPLDIARPHDRITDETAPVVLLDPAHRAFQSPNRIAAADWDDWPQERGLYFAHSWDPAYTPLLEMQDPGREPVRGGLLVARVGRGSYVYTGLSFFRALPAGNVGAFRLFLNLLDLGSAGVP